MARQFYAVLAVVTFLFFFAFARLVPAHATSLSPVAKLLAFEHVPNELVLELVPEPGANAVDRATSFVAAKLGAQAVDSVHSFVMDKQLQIVRLKQGQDLENAITTLRADSNVAIAEPNFIYHATVDWPGPWDDPSPPNDPGFAQTWGLHNTGQADSAGQLGHAGSDINVMPVWAQGFHGDKKIVVAVIDTGMDWSHQDLADNLYTNPNPGNDGTGLANDIHGWNFVANTNDSHDDNHHGTHVSGTIGAEGNNGVGVAGVNWEVTIMPVKFLDGTGSGTLENAVNAINYATKMKVNIMSNSWGGGGYSDALFQAIQASQAAGVLFVVAAGNDSRNDDTTPTYPASYAVDNIVAVAATDNQDKIASFSSYGPKTVHVAAPGVNVYSTFPNNTYSVLSGTSMATPHVSGIAALMMSVHPEWKYTDIKQKLVETSDPVPGLRRMVIAKGRVNAYNALMGIIPPNPDPPDSEWRDVPQVIENLPHPYDNNAKLDFPVHVAGAQYIRVHFDNYSVEAGYDHILILDPAGNTIDDLTGKGTDTLSEYYKGDTITVRLTSDGSVTDYGFHIDKVQMIPAP
jgi:subtilisin family serine protease